MKSKVIYYEDVNTLKNMGMSLTRIGDIDMTTNNNLGENIDANIRIEMNTKTQRLYIEHIITSGI
jgi:hypothetical protein